MLLIIPVKEVNRLQASGIACYISSLTYGPKQAYLANSCLSSKLQLLPTGHRLIRPVLKNDLMSLWKLLMHTWIPQKFPSLREVKGQPCKRGQSWSAAGSLSLLRANVQSCSQLLPFIMVTKLAKDAWLSKKLTSLVCYKPVLRKAVIIPEGQKKGGQYPSSSFFIWPWLTLATLVTNWLTD